jgi:hypothetical protein
MRSGKEIAAERRRLGQRWSRNAGWQETRRHLGERQHDAMRVAIARLGLDQREIAAERLGLGDFR